MKQAELCVRLMDSYFKEQGEIEAGIDFLDQFVVGTDEYFYYLFYSCLLNYGVNSKTYHKNLMLTYQKYPDIFQPSVIVNRYMHHDEEQLYRIIKENIHPRFPNVAFNKWISLSETLYSLDSNISSYLKRFSNYSELYSFIQNMKGYGQKTGGLLLRLIYDSKVYPFCGELSHIPIDRHDLEISFRAGIIDRMDLTEREIEKLSTVWIEAGKKVGLSSSMVDQYLWKIGTTFCVKNDCLFCPLKSACKQK